MRTCLYIKTHRATGLKYFGKTTKDPLKYGGSGLHWKRHIAKHGNDVETEVLGWFEDLEECTNVALRFSIENNIVGSDQWANLIEENGLDGAPVGHDGHQFTDEERARMSEAALLAWGSSERRVKQAAAQSAAWTDERKRKHSEKLKQMHAAEPHRRESHSEKLKQAHLLRRIKTQQSLGGEIGV